MHDSGSSRQDREGLPAMAIVTLMRTASQAAAPSPDGA